MARSLSLAELTALYANKGKNPKALFEYDEGCAINTILPGATTLDKMNKLYFTRQNGLLPLRSKTWPKKSDQTTIAICLVIVDTLHHEDIWREWTEGGEEGKQYKAKLFIHAKYPERIKSAWVKSHLIDVTFRPEWNSVEVVQALLSTLDTALQYTGADTMHNTSEGSSTVDKVAAKCGRFVFATESCLPLYDLQRTGELLFTEDCSWLNAYHAPVGTWEAGACFRSVDSNVVPSQAVWKSLPGWIVLNRRHAAEIVSLVQLLGGWGQQQGSVSTAAAQTQRAKDGYVGSYKGTQAVQWKESAVHQDIATRDRAPSIIMKVAAAAADGATSILMETSPVCALNNDDLVPTSTTSASATADTQVAHETTTTATTVAAPAATPQAAAVASPEQQVPLLSAWGRGGSWHERNGSVFAPEEIFFPTMLSLLGYLRDQPTTDRTSTSTSSTSSGSASSSSTSSGGGASGSGGTVEVKIAAVTFAEWAKRGDANPIQYDHFDEGLVQRMRRTGALFGRKFAPGSVTMSLWQRVTAQLSGGRQNADSGCNSNGRDSSRYMYASRGNYADNRGYEDERRGQGYIGEHDDKHGNNGRYRDHGNSDDRRGYGGDHRYRGFSNSDGVGSNSSYGHSQRRSDSREREPDATKRRRY